MARISNEMIFQKFDIAFYLHWNEGIYRPELKGYLSDTKIGGDK